MNLEQFAALKVGDKIVNGMTNPALYEQCEYSDNWRLRETPK